MKRPEILAPAGDFICLQAAIDAGADAVYFGIGKFNMRAGAGAGFSPANFAEISSRCRERGVKTYLALNIIIFEDELEEVENIIVAARDFVDAVIVSDWGVIDICKKHGVAFHISTQMSVSNSAAVRHLAAAGASRIVLARECTLDEVRRIAAASPVEIECFVHGAQCIAESGRCFMSQDAFGKSACRGECYQPCRRRFVIRAVDVDEDGTTPIFREQDFSFEIGAHTVLSAKDLCSISFIDKLVAAGIASFKIEGRARNANYVKYVTGAYRRAVDAVMAGNFNDALAAELIGETEKVFHRQFSHGMYFGRPGVDQFTSCENSLSTTVKREIGIVENYFSKAGVAQIKIRNHDIAVGDEIQIHGPSTGVVELKVEALMRDDEVLRRASRGEWVTTKTPKCRAGDKVYYVETLDDKARGRFK